MTFVQIICIIGSFAIFVLVAWWCINHDCNNNSQWQKAIDKMTKEKFPYMWKETRPTIDKYVMQRLIELEQEAKELKEEIKRLRNGTR